MAKIIKLGLLMTLIFYISMSYAQVSEFHLQEQIEHRAVPKSVALIVYSQFNLYDVVFQELNLEVDPSVYYIKGAVKFYYKALNPLDTLYFHLSQDLTIDSIIQQNQILNYNRLNDVVMVDIEDLSTSSIDSITIYYQGAPPANNEAFFIAVQDSVNLIPVLATLSEPYGSSDWWPCKNTLTDKIDSIDINITCPIGNRAASEGVLERIDTILNKVTYRWKHRYPITPYLVSIAVSDYIDYSYFIKINEQDSIWFMNYLYQNNYVANETKINLTDQFFKVYDSLFMPYPFANEKYGHVEFPVGGGMEHQTMTSMGVFDYEIIAHELAHQWFGDYITCGSWEDLWLNEGFATYCTGLCYENLANGYWWPIWKEVSLSKIVIDSTGSVFPIDTNDIARLFDARLTYRKASYILHMIRWTIGDDNFFNGIRNYLNNTDLAFGFAKTPNLIAHFEQLADTNLTEFMNDWFYRESYPKYNIEWSQNQEQTFHVQIHQNSATNDGHFFKLFVPLRLIGSNDTLDLRLDHQFDNQAFNIPLNFQVDTVLFDPDLWLISKNASVSLGVNEILKPEIRIYPNPTKDYIYIDTDEKIFNIQIIDSKGQTISYLDSSKQLNIKALNKGIYIIKIQFNSTSVTKKIVKI